MAYIGREPNVQGDSAFVLAQEAGLTTEVTATAWLGSLSGQAFRTGDGTPIDSLGTDGEFYLDTTNTVLFGPKASGSWPTPGVNLIGTAGSLVTYAPATNILTVGGTDYDLDSDLVALESKQALGSADDVLTISGTTISLARGDSSTDTISLPALALTTVQTAATEVAMLALTTQEGDAVVRTDENKSYIRNSGTAGTIADFTLLATPTDVVQSVNGQTGTVTVTDVPVHPNVNTDTSVEYVLKITDVDGTETPTWIESLQLGSAASQALAGNTTTITGGQASAITANTSKVGYTEALVTANTSVVANTTAVAALGTAATVNTGTIAGTIPLLGTNGKIADARLNSTALLGLGTSGSTALAGNTNVKTWDGGTTGLTASTGRNSLELGSVATLSVGTASGNVPVLGTGGKIPTSLLNPVALTSVQTAGAESVMLNLTTEEGDVVVRTDESKSYMRNSGTAGTIADFTELQTPTDLVLSVNGQTGTVAVTDVPIHPNVADDTNKDYVLRVTDVDGAETPTWVEAAISTGSLKTWDGGSTDLNAATGRSSLGLGTAAVANIGTASGNVLAGDTTVITAAQASAISANTSKVGYTEALVSANTNVAANTSKVGYTDALVTANSSVAANTSKVGYTEALVTANTNVAANTAKVGYTEALVSANTNVAANTSKVGYTEALVSANTNVAANTSKVGYTEALVSANTNVAANTSKVGYTDALVTANSSVSANTTAVAALGTAATVNTGTTSGTIPVLDTNGKIPTSVLNPIAITTVQTAATQVAMLALTTQEGDVVVRSDENKSYVRNSGTASTMADFTLLLTPTDLVLSVNGITGAVLASDIATAVEAAAGSNTFTDDDHTKLNNIESNATADQTNAEIKAAVEAASDSNTFTNNDHTKLNNIESNATADQTNAEIKAAVEAASDSNTFTNADHTKVDHISVTSAVNLNTMTSGISTNVTAIALNTAKSTNATHTGDVTGSGALTIASNAVTFAKLEDVATNTIVGRNSGGSGDAKELSVSEVQSMLSIATYSLSGTTLTITT